MIPRRPGEVARIRPGLRAGRPLEGAVTLRSCDH